MDVAAKWGAPRKSEDGSQLRCGTVSMKESERRAGGQQGQNGMWDTAGSKDARDVERTRSSPGGITRRDCG